jgi:hypothetical protein
MTTPEDLLQRDIVTTLSRGPMFASVLAQAVGAEMRDVYEALSVLHLVGLVHVIFEGPPGQRLLALTIAGERVAS